MQHAYHFTLLKLQHIRLFYILRYKFHTNTCYNSLIAYIYLNTFSALHVQLQTHCQQLWLTSSILVLFFVLSTMLLILFVVCIFM